MKFRITTPIEIDANRILSLITNAYDGGMTKQWARIGNIEIPEGFTATWINDQEFWFKNGEPRFPAYMAPLIGGHVMLIDYSDDEIEHKLDLKAITRGLKIMAEDCPRHFGDFIAENDDAITADVFIQCCVFGKVIYG